MKAVSLYSGAGGMDVGFRKAGFNIIWANDFNKDACQTYAANLGDHIRAGDILNHLPELFSIKEKVDIVIGGPPCQGFSVAGKMNPDDPRSEHIWNFVNVVNHLQPRAFVLENVKALGELSKWMPIRNELLRQFRELGYATNFIVLNATNFNVPQNRERVFFIGFKNNPVLVPDLRSMLKPYRKQAPTVRETLAALTRFGTGNNTGVCNAKITIAPNPILRKSPYAGMLFNGLGRPTRIDGYCSTLPASMGGNKTPIIDNDELYHGAPSWVEKYHASLMNGEKPLDFGLAPSNLRRLTVEEAAILQSFPLDFKFKGSQSSKFRQIGNAVPCNLAYAVASMLMNYLMHEESENILLRIPIELDLYN